MQISLANCNTQGFFSLVLDGTICHIHHPNAKIQIFFYQFKIKEHGVKYELGVHPDTGFLVWIGGPTFASMHDICLAKLTGILFYYSCIFAGNNKFVGILNGFYLGKFILADKGYISE